ncbi:ABC transporter ATP-binding protein [Mycoplasmatota bacterium]|nr:ABC transporter ATP-binding protein [Mycoplasmatota bacterium]
MNSTLFRLFGFMKKAFWPYFIGLIFIGLLTMAIDVSLALLIKEMFDVLEHNQILFSKILIPLKRYMWIVLLILVIRPIFYYIVNKSAAITTGNIRTTLFNKLTKLPLLFYREKHSGEVISRMTNDIVEAEKVYKTHLVRFLSFLIAGIGTTTVAFIIQWRMGIIMIISASITILINFYFAKKLRFISRDVQQKLANLTKSLTNILDGMHVIRCFNIHKIILGKFYNDNKDVLNRSNDRVDTQSIISGLNMLVEMVSFFGVATFGAFLVLKGITTIGVIIATVQLQNSLVQLIQVLSRFITNIQGSLAAADRIMEIIDEEEEPEYYITEETDKENLNSAILFDQVSFGYDANLVLKQLSFILPKDKVYAIVGSSGGGKSTIFKLALNFYPPLMGNIAIDGGSISHQSIQKLRQMIAYVPQDAHLFTGTIKENIAYGRLDASFEEIQEAAKLANADNFINEFKEGYHTHIGENGAQLSGGQRQRIAIARAILKNAPILLLDEATSSLDSESEQLVQDALDKLMKNKSTLIIAHRLSTIEHADLILVVQDGIVKEQGTHESLMQSEKGIYKILYQTQYNMSEAT